jgi:hypothetical protein
LRRANTIRRSARGQAQKAFENRRIASPRNHSKWVWLPAMKMMFE